MSTGAVFGRQVGTPHPAHPGRHRRRRRGGGGPGERAQRQRGRAQQHRQPGTAPGPHLCRQSRDGAAATGAANSAAVSLMISLSQSAPRAVRAGSARRTRHAARPAAGQPDDGDVRGPERGLLVAQETGQRAHRVGPVPDPRPGRGDVGRPQRHARARAGGGRGEVDHVDPVQGGQRRERAEQAGIDLPGGQRAAGRAGRYGAGGCAAAGGPRRPAPPRRPAGCAGRRRTRPRQRPGPRSARCPTRTLASATGAYTLVSRPPNSLAHGCGGHDQVAAERGGIAAARARAGGRPGSPGPAAPRTSAGRRRRSRPRTPAGRSSGPRPCWAAAAAWMAAEPGAGPPGRPGRPGPGAGCGSARC